MKISSWNVNSVRARITNILNYLKTSKPDILLIQEIKTEEKNFPFSDFTNLGYESHIFGQKSYNGVAFLSKINIDKINIKFFKDKKNQSRIIVGDIKYQSKIITLINIYVPNGNPIGTEKYEYKKYWYDSFIKKIRKSNDLQKQQLSMLCSLPGVGEKTAIRMLEKFGTPLRVLSSSTTELSKISGLGEARAKNIKKMLEKQSKHLKKTNQKTLHDT